MKIVDFHLDAIYDFVDYCASTGKFKLVDAILIHIRDRIEKYTLDEVLAYLTITYALKSKLKYRESFYKIATFAFDHEFQKGAFKGLR